MIPVVRVLIGMIASGKSTYAKSLADDGWVVVNDDLIVQAVHGGDYLLYNKSLKPLYKSMETHIVHAALALGRNVVIDRGVNTSVRSRRRWVGLASSVDAVCEAVVFPTASSAEHAERRYRADPRGHPLHWWLLAAQQHLLDWEDPTEAEGFSRILQAEEMLR